MTKHKDMMAEFKFCEILMTKIIQNAVKIGIMETYQAGTPYERKSPKYPLAKGYVRNDIIYLRRVLNDVRKSLDSDEV